VGGLVGEAVYAGGGRAQCGPKHAASPRSAVLRSGLSAGGGGGSPARSRRVGFFSCGDKTAMHASKRRAASEDEVRQGIGGQCSQGWQVQGVELRAHVVKAAGRGRQVENEVRLRPGEAGAQDRGGPAAAAGLGGSAQVVDLAEVPPAVAARGALVGWSAAAADDGVGSLHWLEEEAGPSRAPSLENTDDVTNARRVEGTARCKPFVGDVGAVYSSACCG
jgi:hypothetical protein